MATFRDASEAPGTGGGKGRGGKASPRPGPGRAVAFCSPAPVESSSQNSTSLSPLLHVGKHLFRAGKDSESPPASLSNRPPASSYSRLLREGAELEEGAANVLLFTRARRLGSLAAPSPPQPQPASRTPPGASHTLLWALRTQEIPPPQMSRIGTLLGYAVAPSRPLHSPSRPAWSLTLVSFNQIACHTLPL